MENPSRQADDTETKKCVPINPHRLCLYAEPLCMHVYFLFGEKKISKIKL